MLQLCSTLSWSLEMEVDIVDLGAKHVLFLKMFDFVVEDTTEDLHDTEMLVLDMEILVVHRDTAALII